MAHDRDYWLGGTNAERRKSDQNLQKCVNEVAGQMMAEYMYTFVIPGGSPYWMTPYRGAMVGIISMLENYVVIKP